MAEYAVNNTSDFNGDGLFTDCELDMAWAFLQVKALIDSGAITEPTDNEAFKVLVQNQHTLNVNASIAVEGCGTIVNLPVTLAAPAPSPTPTPVDPLPTAVCHLRCNRVHGAHDGTNIPVKPTSLYDSTGNCTGTFTGDNYRFSWPDDALPALSVWDKITMSDLGDTLGNGEFTFHIRFKPDDFSKSPGTFFNKADRLSIWMGTTSIFVKAGNGGITIDNFDLSSYSNGFLNFSIVYKIVNGAERLVSVHLNGTKLGETTVWNDIFQDSAQLNMDAELNFTNKWSTLQEVVIFSGALLDEQVNYLGTSTLVPSLPHFYTSGAVAQGSSALDYNDTIATLPSITNHLVSFEKSDNLLGVIGGNRDWLTNDTTRTGIKIGWDRKLQIPLDFSRDFTISCWAYFDGDPKTFMKIYDGDGENTGNRFDIMAWMKNWWMVKHFTNGSENTLTRYNGFGNNSIFPHREQNTWGGYATTEEENRQFIKSAWNHVTVIKSGDFLQFFINGGYDRRRTGNYVWVPAGDVNSQAASTLEFSSANTEFYISSLYVVYGAVQPTLLYKAPDNGQGTFPAIEGLMEDEYFVP